MQIDLESVIEVGSAAVFSSQNQTEFGDSLPSDILLEENYGRENLLVEDCAFLDKSKLVVHDFIDNGQKEELVVLFLITENYYVILPVEINVFEVHEGHALSEAC